MESAGEGDCKATADTASSADTIDGRDLTVVQKINATVYRAVPRLEDIMTTVRHLEDLEAWIKMAQSAIQDPRTRPSDQNEAQRAIEECAKVQELAVVNMAGMTSLSFRLSQGYYEQILSIIAADVTAAGLDLRIFDALFPEVVSTGQLPIVGRVTTVERQDAEEGSPIRGLDLSESDSEDEFEHVNVADSDPERPRRDLRAEVLRIITAMQAGILKPIR